MKFLQIGSRVINLAQVTDVSHAMVDERGVPRLEVTVSFTTDNFITLTGEHARAAWAFFTGGSVGQLVVDTQVAP